MVKIHLLRCATYIPGLRRGRLPAIRGGGPRSFVFARLASEIFTKPLLVFKFFLRVF